MAEISKRNWPWKKKTQEKIASAPESIESSPRASPHNSKFFDEQDVSKILSDHARVSDEAMTQWQHSEAKLKQLNDGLNVAQIELTAKDILVKQHAKVAEEAVTGWEKAEAETSAMKKQLDTAIHQKLATEDRVSHLAGALKECMRQLRYVREEQEVKIHESTIRKTREYDKLREDMEAKLAEAGQHLQDACSEALDSRGEVHTMSMALQERTKALAEAMDVQACAESKMKVLQAQVQSLEKENSTMQYELNLISKELEIRNGERDCERRVAENAGKNQLENVKKIAKLEAECQKLRLLVRKKLPGPAALAQMKVEVDALDNNYTGVYLQRRRVVCRSASTSPRDGNCPTKSTQECSGAGKDVDILSEKLLEMDDELKMLKETLAKRDEDLQASRLMCAKTASKLSNVEQELETATDLLKRKNTDLCFTCQKECLTKRTEWAHPWNASPALLAGLVDFKKGGDATLDVGKLDLMEDFTEIERLAMATERSVLADREDDASDVTSEKIAEIYANKLIAKQAELEEVNFMFKEVSHQLSQAKEQVAILQSFNSANEAALVRLQEKLDRLCDKQGEEDSVKDRNITKELEDLVEAQSISVRAGAANEVLLYDPKGRSQDAEDVNYGGTRSMSSRSSSELRYEESEHSASVFSDAETKASSKVSELPITVRSLVEAVEALAQATGLEHEPSSWTLGNPTGRGSRQIYTLLQWKDSGLDRSLRILIGMSNKILHGETDMVEFLVELTAVVNYLARSCGKNMLHGEASKGCQADGRNLKMTECEVARLPSAETAIECHSCPGASFPEDSGNLETAHKQNAEIMASLESSRKRLDGTKNQLDGGEKFMSDGSSSLVECEVHELSLSSIKLDRDMLQLLNKVVVLEEELEDEKRQHQEIDAKYHDLQLSILM